MDDDESAAREVTIQRYIADAGYPTPKVLLSGPPTEHLPKRWMLMELVDARPLLAGLDGTRVIAAAPRLLPSLPDTLARHAATLHQLPVNDLLAGLGVNDDVVALIERIRATMVSAGRHDLVAAADELIGSRPDRHREVVCHGDLHPLNVLVGANGTYLIDWSTGLVADPVHDLTFTRWLLANPPIEVAPPVRRALRTIGGMMSRRFATSYLRARHVDNDPRTVEWYERVHAFRVLSELVRADRSDHPFRHLQPDARRRLELPADRHPTAQTAGPADCPGMSA